MNKHICVFLAFQEFDVITKAFESNYMDSIDFFIIENQSKNSPKIKEYFLSKNLVGYIQFEQNISFNAVNIFIRDYFDLLKKYDYITFTDGDFYLYDATDTFKELVYVLDNFKCSFVSVPMYMGNRYILKNPIIGIDKYIDVMKLRYKQMTYSCMEGWTGNNFVTMKNKDLYLIKDVNYVDTQLRAKLNSLKLKWITIKKNMVYHLTWDLYQPGNEYFEWKKIVYPKIWIEIKTSTYEKIK